MKDKFSINLIALAEKLPLPLYVVGGLVRNFLIDKSFSTDFDLASPLDAETVEKFAVEQGFKIVATYKRTGTVVFCDSENKYEFTSFRKESYHGGEHTPYAVEFTNDIVEDAKRRDFKCNAVYYDLKNGEFVDPLGGIEDIKNRVLDTVCSPKQVFEHDGLRLMRLARFAGQLNFTPKKEVLDGAREYADNIKEISVERVYDELKLILTADKKYAFSNKIGHYTALKILDQTRVLDRIIPELTKGRGMAQRADFHNFDVLEHTLKSVLYADEKIRLSALLHDIGKPYCMENYGEFYRHDKVGGKIAESILKRLKADTKSIEEVRFLVRYHMIDIDCKMGEKKIKKFVVENYKNLPLLFMLKQADFKACKEQGGIAPAIEKWKKIIADMKDQRVPFSLKELKISAKDLIEIGYIGSKIGLELKNLWEYLIFNPNENNSEKLIKMAKNHLKN